MKKYKVIVTTKMWWDITFLIKSNKNKDDIIKTYKNSLPSYIDFLMLSKIRKYSTDDMLIKWLNIFQSIVEQISWKKECITKVYIKEVSNDYTLNEDKNKNEDNIDTINKELIDLLKKMKELL